MKLYKTNEIKVLQFERIRMILPLVCSGPAAYFAQLSILVSPLCCILSSSTLLSLRFLLSWMHSHSALFDLKLGTKSATILSGWKGLHSLEACEKAAHTAHAGTVMISLPAFHSNHCYDSIKIYILGGKIEHILLDVLWHYNIYSFQVTASIWEPLVPVFWGMSRIFLSPLLSCNWLNLSITPKSAVICSS